MLCLAAQPCPLFTTPWSVTHRAPLSVGFSRQDYWSGLPCPPPGDLPHPVTESRSPTWQADSLPAEAPGKAGFAHGSIEINAALSIHPTRRERLNKDTEGCFWGGRVDQPWGERGGGRRGSEERTGVRRAASLPSNVCTKRRWSPWTHTCLMCHCSAIRKK